MRNEDVASGVTYGNETSRQLGQNRRSSWHSARRFLPVSERLIETEVSAASWFKSWRSVRVLQSILIFAFGIAVVGVFAWIIAKSRPDTSRAPTSALGILAVLVVAVLLTAIAGRLR